MSVSESLLFDLVPGETLERLVIDGELFYYGWTPAREGTAGTIVCLHGVASNASRCCLLYTSPSPRDRTRSRMPSSA